MPPVDPKGRHDANHQPCIYEVTPRPNRSSGGDHPRQHGFVTTSSNAVDKTIRTMGTEDVHINSKIAATPVRSRQHDGQER
jgi:hypothetical protein